MSSSLPEARPPRQLGGAREHVGVAPRRPEIANAVLSETDRDPELDDRGERERVGAPGRNGGERDPLLGQLLEQRLDGGVAVAEAERVRDGDPALQAEGARALDDQADLPPAERAAVVQMDVDAAAAAVGDPEDRVEMRDGISVEPCRVDAADERRARLDRRVEQVGGTGGDQHAALRERDDLDVDPVAEPCGCLEDALDRSDAVVEVDVDVRPDQRRSVRAVRLEEGAGTLGHRRQLAPADPLVLDQCSKPGAGRMRSPRLSPERLVDVGMAVDEPWEHEASTCVERWAFPALRRDADGVDPAAADDDVGRRRRAGYAAVA